MALHLIIDGYNLMGAARGGGLNPGVDLEFSREALLKRLHTFRIRKPLRITVVFDGKEAKTTWESRAGIRVAFAGGRGRADEAIAGMVRGNPQGVVVATSDRALAENCRRMGAAVISSQELWGRLERALGYREAGLELPKEDSWEEESLGGWGSKKKGPARRLSRKERRQARKLRKL